MGKYSSVSISNLKNTVNNALSELNKYNLENITNSLNGKDVLSCSIENNVKKLLKDIKSSKSINGSIKVLNDKLKNLQKAVDNIEKCQEYEKKIKNLNASLYAKDGKLNINVYNQIKTLERSLSSYESKADSYLK